MHAMRLLHGFCLFPAGNKAHIGVIVGQAERMDSLTQKWLQIRGDPSIRRFLFAQTRQQSALDGRYNAVIRRTLKLFAERGVFQVQIHFSSSQITVWSLDDPFTYEVLLVDEFLAPAEISRRSDRDYPPQAVVRPFEIEAVLERLGQLRFDDDVVYLRSGSLNIMNGTVGLTFSCDGSHYLDYRDFLASREFLVN